MLNQDQLDDWQKDILGTEGDILLCTGRQVGKTTIFAYKAASELILKRDIQIIVVSLTEDQAQLIIAMALGFLEDFDKKKICSGKKRPTKNRIQLKNGSKIRARPVGLTGDSVRGFTGDILIVDEASRMPEEVWTSAKPTLLTTSGDIWMCSTPFGRKGYFYECYKNPDRFKIFHVSSEEVIKNRDISNEWTETQRKNAINFLDQEKKEMTELQYSQEYLAQFVDELRQFFPDRLINKCQQVERQDHINSKNTNFLGVDVARLGEDETTLEAFRLTENKDLIQEENIILKKKRTTETTRQIIELDKRYKFNKIFVDTGGIGGAVFDQLFEEEQTKRRVVAINNARKEINREGRKKTLMKEDLYNHILSLMERGKVQLLKDADIFQSFKSVQYEYSTDKKGKPYCHLFGNYTHIVEGCVRGVWGEKGKHLNIWLDSIKV